MGDTEARDDERASRRQLLLKCSSAPSTGPTSLVSSCKLCDRRTSSRWMFDTASQRLAWLPKTADLNNDPQTPHGTAERHSAKHVMSTHMTLQHTPQTTHLDAQNGLHDPHENRGPRAPLKQQKNKRLDTCCLTKVPHMAGNIYKSRSTFGHTYAFLTCTLVQQK